MNNDSKPLPTIRSIAQKAGLSASAVSLALRQHPSIPSETRKRVEAIAEDLGYQRNPMVSTLMSHLKSIRTVRYTASLAFLTPVPAVGPGDFRARYFLGAQKRAASLGYTVEEYVTEAGPSMGGISRVLRTRGILGVILSPLLQARGHVNLDWEDFSSVAIGHTIWKPVLHRVTNNQAHTMRTALRSLRLLGYRRIGLVINMRTDERVDRQLTGTFLADQLRRNPAENLPIYVTKDTGIEEKTLRKWVQANRPDVVISLDIHVLEALQTMGLRVPEEIGYVYLDWVPGLNCAGVDQGAEILGAACVESLVAQIERNERGIPANPKTITMEGKWIDGPTLSRSLQVRRAEKV